VESGEELPDAAEPEAADATRFPERLAELVREAARLV